MCFGGSDLSKDICTLSGGERIRLLLCQLFLGRYNILILDEPTNFLDIDAILALEKFIQGYEGTIVLVSHDRTFVKRIADVQYNVYEYFHLIVSFFRIMKEVFRLLLLMFSPTFLLALREFA